jgi:hypothetical protein
MQGDDMYGQAKGGVRPEDMTNEVRQWEARHMLRLPHA